MHFPTSLALLGSALTVSGAAISSFPLTNTTETPFALSAVVLSIGEATPLAVEPTEGEVLILRAASPNATSLTGTGTAVVAASSQFTYDAASRQLRSALLGGLLSDLLRENVTVTFAEFESPADGLFALKQDKSAKTYFVYAPDAAGRVDGWSLCGVTAFYWSGSQDPLAGCAKVALERK
ncbi:hypothetical protein F5B17DRAFT_433082 [Nemania serpens]|nr:hypothetical protein F5B17DRAFT_433082 [Nemania serpens]